jgi:hypothetical protein
MNRNCTHKARRFLDPPYRHEACTRPGEIPENVRLTRADSGGRYWVRTSDLFGVNEARYHCANRPLERRPPYLKPGVEVTEPNSPIVDSYISPSSLRI